MDTKSNESWDGPLVLCLSLPFLSPQTEGNDFLSFASNNELGTVGVDENWFLSQKKPIMTVSRSLSQVSVKLSKSDKKQ
jgi:hypothetical protein